MYDCTVALHYGGELVDAYSRRGIALARLKLWDKAIIGQSHTSPSRKLSLMRSLLADFEKALALEPKNPIVKRELAKAKQQIK